MRIIGRNDGDREQGADMRWGILALLLMTGPGDQSHEPQLVVFGPCCGPPTRQAEPVGELEACS